MLFVAMDFKTCYSAFQLIGAAVCCFKLMKLSCFVFENISVKIKKKCGWSFRWLNLGEWAVVTGGTDGIGKAYAQELAAKGFNICLISRNIEKLISVAEELEQKYNIMTKIINCDFTRREIYTAIQEELDELEGGIGVLVNNVGMSYKYAEYFHELPNGLKAIQDLINSNVTSCTMMMRIVMPQMLSRRSGVIINISSLMAVYPMPLLNVYAACKAYVDYLSRATQFEYKNKGLIIQSVLPGYVATKMSNRRISLEVPTAETFVSKAIETVGEEDHTYGYFAHRIRGFVHEWLKANMPTRVNMAIAMYYMRKNRESYFKRLQKRRNQDK
ncbi:very-long-chain 3-oxoacyl-CoA reductase-like [Uloborus diversus]|uniref:very-long-chain 3-oxoacyl-CoA reductase-like n=1 Tax=Uloborus diversus TaxID=327109 RepID=UPI00240990F2|nr:very-long-chain 3-oxoacyl-CoA reductase-like [Uloborus diversus]